jgi:hypothetical protein
MPKLLLFILLLLIAYQPIFAQQHDTATIKEVNPPFMGFYTKYLDADGIPIRSGSVVDDKALYIARDKINMMLKHMENARKNLLKNGAEFHIIGRDQQTSDLPENTSQKSVKYMDHGVLTDIDARTRGTGGLYASCGEENLLGLPNDRYAGGSDICVHEFAHDIMDYGLDSVLNAKIKAQWQRTVALGYWKGAYAASNEQEYWAELSMWYFGKHGEFLRYTQKPAPGAEGLRSYDTAGYKLLDSIYSGILQPKVETIRMSVAAQKGDVSYKSAKKSEITITNSRSAEIKVYWIDYNGNAKLYAIMQPKQRVIEPTYYGHVWMVSDNKDQILVYIRVYDPPCAVELKDPQ